MAEDWARPVVHWEIYAKDQDKIRSFYREMFNWQIAAGPVALVGAGIGAPDAEQFTGHILPGETSRVVLDIQVLDLKASMAKAESPRWRDHLAAGRCAERTRRSHASLTRRGTTSRSCSSRQRARTMTKLIFHTSMSPRRLH